MSAVTARLERPVKAGRRAMDRTLQVVEKQVGPAMTTRRGQVISGMVVVAACAFTAGALVYRRRRPRTLVARIQHALPDELVERAGSIKKRALG